MNQDPEKVAQLYRSSSKVCKHHINVRHGYCAYEVHILLVAHPIDLRKNTAPPNAYQIRVEEFA